MIRNAPLARIMRLHPTKVANVSRCTTYAKSRNIKRAAEVGTSQTILYIYIYKDRSTCSDSSPGQNF